MSAERILVVDDERAGRLSLVEILRLEGYVADMSESGEEAIAHLQRAKPPYDLMLLDLKMPGMDGMEVLVEARRLAPDMQIIFLTAHGSLESAIAALRHGAHDYLLKPSPAGDILESVRQGLARKQAERRRQQLLESLESSVRELRRENASVASEASGISELSSRPEASGPGDEMRLVVGGLTLDLGAHEATSDGQAVTLTPTELRLLAVLMRQPGKVVSPAQIVREVHGYEAGSVEAAEIVRPIISRLRRKLAKLPGAQDLLVTVKGAGYRFERRRT